MSHSILSIAVWMLSWTMAAATVLSASEPPTPEQAASALLRAVQFFHAQVSFGGGYLWEYSGDLKLREAEGKVYDSRVWVQPPGTPTIGEAFLEAYEATGDRAPLEAALDAAYVLVESQLHSGGWDYYVTLDPAEKQPLRTCLDDDTTQAALRFLMRADKTLGFRDAKIHAATIRGLESLLVMQYPNGAWFVFWKTPPKPYPAEDYPVLKASYPATWSRTPERAQICYILNDNLVPDVVHTMLDAWEVYRDKRYLAAAKKGGDFLRLAQMPEPQPAWAQTYDVKMKPVWGRKFEPPAISGAESQTVLESLLALYRRTGEKKYLAAVPTALAYLRRSRLPDGRLARFYELQTNRPLYFTRDYQLTYSSDDMPAHYKFIWESRLEAIEAEYQGLLVADPATLASPPKADPAKLAAQAAAVTKALDSRGAWVERGIIRFHKVEPPSGVIKCQTFADHVHLLSQFLVAARGAQATESTTTEVARRFQETRKVRREAAGKIPQAQDRPRREGDRPREGVAREGDQPGRRADRARDGDRPRTGPRDGEGPGRGPREADAPTRPGPRDGEGARRGPREGDAPAKGRARDGDASPGRAPREGNPPARQGSKDPAGA